MTDKTIAEALAASEGTTPIDPVDERMCECGHDIHCHEDYDFNIHECTHFECSCLQFNDRFPVDA
jgi:hypothetical protein